MAIMDIFVGSAQSKYAGMAIIVSLLAVALVILFSKEKVPFGEKIVIVLLMFLMSLPAILYALFQITCLVTGSGGPGIKGKTWWCGLYAWFITAIVFVYAVMIVVMSILALTGKAEATKVEQFYAQKDVYDAFAADEMKKEEEGGAVPSQPVVDETAIVAPGSPVPVVGVEGFEGETGAEPEKKEEEGVAPTVEGFTTCGAPFQTY